MTLAENKKSLYTELYKKALKKAADDFPTYAQIMAPVIVPENFTWGRHLQKLAETLQLVEEGKITRLMIELSPGASKSSLVTLFESWCLGRHSAWKILGISHSGQLAMKFSRFVKDIVSSVDFPKVFPKFPGLRADVQAAGYWYLDKTGGMFVSAGVGAGIAGERANLAVLDDPLSEQTAESELERRNVIDWYGPGLKTRMLPDARMVIVSTRWRLDDLSGYLLDLEKNNPEADKWTRISIPAILDAPSAKFLNLPEGGSYWPEYWPLDKLLAKKNAGDLSPAKWAALYMQSPVPEEGSIIKNGWIKWWKEDKPPRCDYVIQTLDTAFSVKTTADYSVIATWGIFHEVEANEKGKEIKRNKLILLNCQRGRWDYTDLRQKAQFYGGKEFGGPNKPDLMLIEKKASGQSLLQDLARAGLPVREYNPEKDKITRAHIASPLFERGLVWFPDKHWAKELVQELLEFPYGKNDDFVDTTTMACHFLKNSWYLEHPLDPIFEAKQKTKRSTYWSMIQSS